MRSRKRQAETFLTALGYVVGSIFVLGASIGLGTGAAYAIRTSTSKILEVELWAVFLFWQLVPLLLEGFSPSLNFREVARYPISLRLYAMLNAAYGLFDPAAIAGTIWLFSIWLGITIMRPGLALPVGALLLVFKIFNIFCNRSVVGLFERLQSTRKGRERVVAALLVLMFVPQLINLAVNGFIHIPKIHMFAWMFTAINIVRRVTPPGLLVQSLNPADPQQWLSLFLLLSYPLLVFMVQLRQLRAIYFGEIYAESFVVNRELKIEPGWRLPFLDDCMSAVVEKELRYIRQNSRLLVTLVYPLILFLMMLLGGPARRMFSFHNGGNLLGAFAGFIGLAVSNVAYNSFGMDREGFGRWLLAPLPLEKVILAKNLAHGLIMSAVYFTGATVIVALGRISVSMFIAVTAGFFSVLVIQLGAGSWLSVYWPKRIEFTQMSSRMTSSASGFASLAIVLPLAGVNAAVVFATWYWQLSWLPLAAGLIGLALSCKFYFSLVRWAVRYADDHLEEISGQLAG